MLSPTTTTENAFGAAFVSACQGLGIPYNPDYNSGANMRGVSPIRSTINASFRRVTSYEVYVAPFLGNRPNLTVVTGALVTGIEFSGTTATGVSYVVSGQPVTAGVQREVILSAGAINSPKLLMLSGIGDAAELRRLGVSTIVADLPGVGKNLQEAIIFLATWSSAQPILDQPVNEGYAIVWDTMVAHDQPMTCIEMMRGNYTCDESQPTLEGSYSVTGGAMRLESKGSVALRSLDPSAPPIIDLNLLSAPGDYAQCLKAFQVMREIGNSPGLAAWRRAEVVPGPSVTTPEQIRQWILNNAWPYNHPSGTCGMGRVSQPVLDAEMRVLGVQGLRVMDVSVMPRITSGHIQAPAFMIGDKGADLLLRGH
jgi:choline dehydrogenase